MWSIAQGIASGMDYLHNDANQIHGDLAARNCLLGHNDSVKIGDFGKFNDNYSNDYCYGAGGVSQIMNVVKHAEGDYLLIWFNCLGGKFTLPDALDAPWKCCACFYISLQTKVQ